ncbi:hypothetical protein ZIOFF_011549 [Zingiber officinale]|uniref:Uncharacterized protein n=1 Tax=Zingiber officinale TaxID=94328 RepID=A0A8J5LZS7_ZINOF|nr:hypothetical protein ZIOFF_011549 [Zingiber officinale]
MMNMNRQILRGRKDDDKRKRESALYSSDVNHGLVAKQLSEGPSFKHHNFGEKVNAVENNELGSDGIPQVPAVFHPVNKAVQDVLFRGLGKSIDA